MRLIDADALKKEVDNFPNCYNGWSDTYDKAYIIEAIEEAPTIEPKRGEWIEWIDCEGEVFWKCSACGQVSEASAAGILYKFCPFCGARMKGADDE